MEGDYWSTAQSSGRDWTPLPPPPPDPEELCAFTEIYSPFHFLLSLQISEVKLDRCKWEGRETRPEGPDCDRGCSSFYHAASHVIGSRPVVPARPSCVRRSPLQ
ncbi:uncharacterized protein ACWYII_025609 isoform 1-T2 [Salvelinus alpinus]